MHDASETISFRRRSRAGDETTTTHLHLARNVRKGKLALGSRSGGGSGFVDGL